MLWQIIVDSKMLPKHLFTKKFCLPAQAGAHKPVRHIQIELRATVLCAAEGVQQNSPHRRSGVGGGVRCFGMSSTRYFRAILKKKSFVVFWVESVVDGQESYPTRSIWAVQPSKSGLIGEVGQRAPDQVGKSRGQRDIEIVRSMCSNGLVWQEL